MNKLNECYAGLWVLSRVTIIALALTGEPEHRDRAAAIVTTSWSSLQSPSDCRRHCHLCYLGMVIAGRMIQVRGRNRRLV